ncbi:MAG: hypothetical protein OIN88_13935 [Candidatus Methanoperedens sp.]|nr:hypothetical protein [Candidatus Methanoperedens sp.]MCZ7361176.1 hypothetical protein [Candidatus Methanoperedens sp.]HLB72191.1 hypothetical protein [Candidatus Methanoperedens sp.]
MISIEELEEEIIEIEKVKERCEPGSLEWNNIDSIITDKKRELIRLKTQEDSEEEEIIMPGSCGGDCGGCGGVR